MPANLHTVSKFTDGILSIATVNGLEAPGKHWILYAGRGKFVIRPDAPFREEQFGSPEQALQESQRTIQAEPF
jgi:hypothetical protein